jgi:hypothetical protein
MFNLSWNILFILLIALSSLTFITLVRATIRALVRFFHRLLLHRNLFRNFILWTLFCQLNFLELLDNLFLFLDQVSLACWFDLGYWLLEFSRGFVRWYELVLSHQGFLKRFYFLLKMFNLIWNILFIFLIALSSLTLITLARTTLRALVRFFHRLLLHRNLLSNFILWTLFCQLSFLELLDSLFLFFDQVILAC